MEPLDHDNLAASWVVANCVSRTGRSELRLPYRYLGADDRAGANYTGQPAVHSYYTMDS